ncbi:unnamed protein product, partial [Symbiodinium necroappetens]
EPVLDSQVLLLYEDDTGEDSQIPSTLDEGEAVLYRPGWKNLMISMQEKPDKQPPEIQCTSTLHHVLKKDDTEVAGAALAKAKAGASKAKAKPVKKEVLKKPSAAESATSAAAGPINQTIDDLRNGDPALCEKRDKGKGVRFSKDRDSLPPHVLHLIDKESRGNRAFKSIVINKLYQRQPDGSLRLCLSDPIFSEAQQLYTNSYSKTKQHSLPETVMLASHFGGNERLFQEAARKGEIFSQKGPDNIMYWSFKSWEIGCKDGKMVSQKLDQQKKVSKDQAEELLEAFGSVNWKFTPKQFEKGMIEDHGEISASSLNLLKQAIQSEEKLCKETNSLLKSTGLDSDFIKSLKVFYTKATAHIASLNQLKELNMMPDATTPTEESVKQLFLDIAEHTSKFNDSVEIGKAKLKAQKN